MFRNDLVKDLRSWIVGDYERDALVAFVFLGRLVLGLDLAGLVLLC